MSEFKINYSKDAKSFFEKDEVEKYLEEFQDFFPQKMVNLYEDRLKSFVVDNMSTMVRQTFTVNINKEILDKWVNMCMNLDNIPSEEIKDIATKNLVRKLQIENACLKGKIEDLKMKLEEIKWGCEL